MSFISPTNLLNSVEQHSSTRTSRLNKPLQMKPKEAQMKIGFKLDEFNAKCRERERALNGFHENLFGERKILKNVSKDEKFQGVAISNLQGAVISLEEGKDAILPGRQSLQRIEILQIGNIKGPEAYTNNESRT